MRKAAYFSDGKMRVVEIGEADSYFSAPARAKVNGRTVTGFVFRNSDGTRCFSANQWQKNADALPKWPD